MGSRAILPTAIIQLSSHTELHSSPDTQHYSFQGISYRNRFANNVTSVMKIDPDISPLDDFPRRARDHPDCKLSFINYGKAEPHLSVASPYCMALAQN